MIQKRLFSSTVAFVMLAAGVLVVAAPTPAYADAFRVNRAGDAPDLNTAGFRDICDTKPKAGRQCTLRAAIMEANSSRGGDLITFRIPGRGRHTIRPQSQLPTITGTVTIDGYSEPGASVNTRKKGSNAKLMIAINGTEAGNETSGLVLQGVEGALIRGLAINNFSGELAGGNGIQIGGRSSGNVIEGNFIGMNSSGTAPQGNGAAGISLMGEGDNLVGGVGRATRNVISGNGSDGVSLSSPSNVGNSILGNSIYRNAGLGIDIGEDGETANDVNDLPGQRDDMDPGANLSQNFPQINAAYTYAGGITTVEGELSSTGDQSPESSDRFKIQLFSNPPGGNEGKKLVETFVLIDDSHEPAEFAVQIPTVPRDNTITATATDADGNTSEFSDKQDVGRPPPE